MKKRFTSLPMTLLLVTLLAHPSLMAFWPEDGVDICTEADEQIWPVIVTDGAGGAIIARTDGRDAGGSDIYAQRVNPGGDVLWTANGIAVCTAPVYQWYPDIVSDGAGGAIIAWLDFRDALPNVGIYVQRVDASGGTLWTANGIAVCTNAIDPMSTHDFAMTADGSGGAIIAWEDTRTGGMDIKAQRIDASGTILWAAEGVFICDHTSFATNPRIVSDGVGGAIITWEDDREPSGTIYAQRVDASGSALWTANGVAVLAITGGMLPQIASDGAGGAIITWTDTRYGLSEADIYAQRLDASGNALWAANGVPVSEAAAHQQIPAIVSDGAAGALIVWGDYRSGTDFDVYAQRADPMGNMLWTADGVAICTEVNGQVASEIVSDGCGGAYIVWTDSRNGTSSNSLYAQRIDALGDVHWPEDGVPVSGVQGNPLSLYKGTVFDGIDGAIVTWQYDDGITDDNIYAQRIDANGKWGNNAPVIIEILDVPADQGGEVTVTWLASALDVSPEVTISRYSIWRRLSEAAAAVLLASVQGDADWQALLSVDERSVHPEPAEEIAASPVYRFTESAGTTYGWEFLLYRDADYSATYTDTVGTLFDSTAVTTGMHHFMVTAHTAHQWTFWDSAPDSGYSVDNIAPAMPSGGQARQSFDPEGLELRWNANTDPDLGYYRVYRGSEGEAAAGRAVFTNGEMLLVTTPDTTCFDGEWRWYHDYYYKITAVDIHGNEGAADSIGRGEVTGDAPMVTPKATFLDQNHPNPFNPNTTISFGLHEPGHVTLRIYDVAGRLVDVLVDGHRSAGVYRESWDGIDRDRRAVASGLYFYRLEAGSFIETKKMILLK